MSFRVVVVTCIAMNTQVKFCPVLYDRLIERGEDEVVLIVEIGYGHHKKTLVFCCIAARYGCILISTPSICSQNISVKRVLQVNHQLFVKFQVTHRCII